MHPLTRRGASSFDAAVAHLTSRRGRRLACRGVTMIEYVLLIAIAVVLAWLLRDQLTSMFQGILDDISRSLETT